MIYFDNAATTFPKPKEVIDRLMEVYTGYAANPGRSGHKLALRMDREIYETRELLTDFVGGKNPMNTVFTSNSTESLNTAIRGVIDRHMHVITTSMEHNSVLRPLHELEKRSLIELTVVKGDSFGRVTPEMIEAELRSDTGVVVTTHMSNLTGTIIDVVSIGELLRERGIIYIVDAAQSLGVLEVDVERMNIDILCYPGHKGLYGPMGTGGMYIRDGISVQPLKYGGTGSFSALLLQPELMPDRLESGTPNGPGIAAMGSGVKFIESVGIGSIRAHENALKDRFIKGLMSIKDSVIYGPMDDSHGPVVAMNIEGMDSSELGYILSEDYDIYVRPGLHCAPLAHETIGTTDTGAVRFSFGYFNTSDEVDHALEVLEKIVKENE